MLATEKNIPTASSNKKEQDNERAHNQKGRKEDLPPCTAAAAGEK